MPPQPPREVSYRLDQGQHCILDAMLQELADQGVIVPCNRPKFLAGVFLTPKQEPNSFRLIIDLSSLNKLVRKVKFKMENLQLALDQLDQGDWMAKIDLKNAYYSIPIASHHQPYLAFNWGQHHWMFTRLCFGLSPAPRIFTKVLKPVVAWLRSQGAKLVAYLDDFWIAHASRATCRDLTVKMMQRLSSLGFTISDTKSIIHPRQSIEFLGMTISSVTMTVALPSRKCDKLLHLIRAMLTPARTSGYLLSRLIGGLEAIRPAFAMAPLYFRALQRWMMLQELHQNGRYSTALAPLQEEQLQELRFWERILPRLEPQNITEYRGSALRLESDASDSGWGVTLGNRVAHGQWTQTESNLHINVKETLSILKGLQTFSHIVRGRIVVIGADNTSALAYIRKKGGVRSRHMCDLAIQIWELALSLRVNLETVFIRGVDNIRPDHLSRLHQLDWSENKEWILNRAQFRQIARTWGPLFRDLFASHWNNQLPLYMTWEEPHTMRNAFHFRWHHGDYAFPPFSIIMRVLRKVKADRCRIAIVVPWWEAQAWLPMLKRMLISDPIHFRFYPGLLRDQAGNPHPLGRTLQLTACLIDGRS